MDIASLLSPIALSSLLTKKVQGYFQGIDQPHLASAIHTVFVKNSSVFVYVSHTLARTEIRMHGEALQQIVAKCLASSETYSIRIVV